MRSLGWAVAALVLILAGAGSAPGQGSAPGPGSAPGRSGTPGQGEPGPPLEFVSPEQVLAHRAAGRPVRLLDVRTREEFEAIHIQAAVSLPLGELERRHAEVPREGLVVLY
jgi:hypothetical protein